MVLCYVDTEKGKRMRIITVIFLWLLTINTLYAEIYTYKDAEGNIVFSDVAVKGAEKVIVPPVITYESKNTVNESAKLIEQTSSHKPYQSLTILAPKQDETIWDNLGELTVQHALVPRLQEGDTVQLYIDEVLQDGLSIKGIYRGEHKVRLQVIDSNGYAHITSEEVVFYVRHHIKRSN